MATVKFSAKLLIRGINPYVLISRVRAERIKEGWRKPMPVVARVNGQPNKPWHVNMMPVGNGDFYLYLHGGVRQASGAQVGDVILLKVDFDPGYQGGPAAMPEWFAKALAARPKAQANWQRLSPSRQKEVVRYFANLKSPAAQARNLERAIRVLLGAEEQFMGRSWRAGS